MFNFITPKILFAGSLALGFSGAYSASPQASPCGPGMSGAAKSIVHYAPGTHMADAPSLMPKHLEFLKAQMASGALQYAGPIVAAGAPTGRAVMIYHSTDAEIVRAIVQTDPMVKADVFSYEVGTWVECKAADAL